MPTLRRNITKELALEESRKHKSRKEFQLSDPSLYSSCRIRGWLDDVCNHMTYAPTGFNDEIPGYLYQIRFTLQDGTNVWKIGITNRPPELRLARMKPPKWCAPEIEISRFFEIGSEARLRETEILQKGAASGLKYTGEKFLKNGHSEIFTAPLLFK